MDKLRIFGHRKCDQSVTIFFSSTYTVSSSEFSQYMIMYKHGQPKNGSGVVVQYDWWNIRSREEYIRQRCAVQKDQRVPRMYKLFSDVQFVVTGGGLLIIFL